MIAAALAHVALTKCKWRHPSNCRQKGSRGPTVVPAITGSIKAKLPLRFVRPIYQPHARKRARGKTSRETVGAAISHVAFAFISDKLREPRTEGYFSKSPSGSPIGS